MLCCMSFNFASLVELAIVGHLTKDGKGDGAKIASSCRSRSRRKSGRHKSGVESSVSPKMCKFVHQHAQDPSSPITRYVLDDEPAAFGAGFVGGMSSNGDPQVAPCLSAYPTVASSNPRFYPSVRPTNSWDDAPARRSRRQTFAPLFCCYRCGRRTALYCRDALDCTTGRPKTSTAAADDYDDADGDDPDGGFGRTLPTAAAKSSAASRKLTADFIDQASCFIFPALFSFFNVCYWAIYSSEWQTDKK
uniref:Uncharacterized protein n=1 Tax=Romanomermis culicivorax TaxID=13658 RepID=A0A915J2N0_ROMCU